MLMLRETEVADTIVYSGPEGRITRQEGLAFTQFLAVRSSNRRSRYFATQAAAHRWLSKASRP